MQAKAARAAITATENLLCYNRGPFREWSRFLAVFLFSAQAVSSARQDNAAGKIQEEK
jgi:hypothetical protein